jgi:hypothetical protein
MRASIRATARARPVRWLIKAQDNADVAEPVDATDLKSVEGDLVRVRVPPSAPSRREQARKLLAAEHKQERADFSRHYRDAKKQVAEFVRVRYKAEIDAQRVKRTRHIGIPRERNVQAENFADIGRQKRESEREQMRQITQRKTRRVAKRSEGRKRTEREGGRQKGRAVATDSFARVINKAAKQEAQRPKDRDLGRDYER